MKSTMISLATAGVFALVITTCGCSSDEKQQTQPTASGTTAEAKTPAAPSPMERKPAENQKAEAKPAAESDKAAGDEAKTAAAAEALTRAFKVTGMHCSGCENMICTKLKAMEGVKSAQASHKKERVVVMLDGSKEVSDAALIETIQKAGGDYKAEPLPKE